MLSCVDHKQSMLLSHYPLARHTSWRIGGWADQCYLPHSIEDLQHFLAQRPDHEALTWLGLGSNVLIRDAGIAGVVIITHRCLSGLTLYPSGVVRCEAGVPCAKLAQFCRKHNLNGLFLAGIPGTVGGALAMNAGAFGGETWQYVTHVDTIDHRGRLRSRKPEAFQIGYRSVQGAEQEWFVAGYFRFPEGESNDIARKTRAMLQARGARQPTKSLSCGSVFCNPKGDAAGRLIEHCGLKGYRIGGAQVAMQHANFILNTGGATAEDVERLMEHIVQCVEQSTGVVLNPEVRILGRRAASNSNRYPSRHHGLSIS